MSVELAHRLADIAAGVALPYVARGVVEETKDDSPVGQADLATDAALIDEIRRARGAARPTGRSCTDLSSRRIGLR